MNKGGNLILTLCEGDDVVITDRDGARIEVCAVKVKGDRVRLGFRAPRRYQINRRGVHEAIQAERAAACAGAQKGGAS